MFTSETTRHISRRPSSVAVDLDKEVQLTSTASPPAVTKEKMFEFQSASPLRPCLFHSLLLRMAFLRKSLSEDSLDRYSHTWSFLFLLLLSVVTLFISLSPSLTLTQPTPFTTKAEKKKPDISKEMRPHRYKADCWTPEQFTNTHTAYCNAVCAAAFNSVVQGKNSTTASLIKVSSSSSVVPGRDTPHFLVAEDFQEDTSTPENSDIENNKTVSRNTGKDEEERKQHEAKVTHLQEEVHSGIQNLISYKTPLFLFLFAICLRLPRAIWSLLSNCCGCMNIDQTLSAAQTAHSLNSGDRHRLLEEISVCLGRSSRKLSLLFLLMKLLMTMAVCIEAAVLCHCLLAETDNLDKDVHSLRTLKENIINLADANNPVKAELKPAPQPFDPQIFMCGFGIRLFVNLKQYTLQCVFSFDGRHPDGDDEVDAGPQIEESEEMMLSESLSKSKILLMYKALFTMVLALLVLLALFNILSLLAWVFKLVLTQCRPCLDLKADASLDVVFVVSMAFYNTSAGVAVEVAKCSPWGHDDKKDGESSKLGQGLNDDLE